MLKVENVNLFYGAAQALRGVSLSAAVGRVTCVLGRNGVGKSSLMRAIVGHQPIRDGAIQWQAEEASSRQSSATSAGPSSICVNAAILRSSLSSNILNGRAIWPTITS